MIFVHSAYGTGNNSINCLYLLIYTLNSFNSVWIAVFNVWFSEIGSKCPFLVPKQNAVSHFVLKLSTDFAELPYQTFLDVILQHIKRRSKSKQYWRRESVITVMYKMAAMTSSNYNFQKMRKTAQEDIPESICVNFHQNQTSRLGCIADTRTHTDTHTYRHPRLDSKIFSQYDLI